MKWLHYYKLPSLSSSLPTMLGVGIFRGWRLCLCVCPAGCLTGWWKWSPNPPKPLGQMKMGRPLLQYVNKHTHTHTSAHLQCRFWFFSFSLFSFSCLPDLIGPQQKQTGWGLISTCFKPVYCLCVRIHVKHERFWFLSHSTVRSPLQKNTDEASDDR